MSGIIPSSTLCKSLRRMGISSSVYVWQNFPVSSSGPGHLFVGSVFIMYCFISNNQSIQLICFFLIQFWQAVCLLGCHICWHIIVYSILFVFLQCSLRFHLFHLFCLSPFSPLLGEPSHRFVNFVYRFKKPALGFLAFFNCFLNSILLISSLIFMISFLLFVLLFPNLLGGGLSCWFEIFLLF